MESENQRLTTGMQIGDYLLTSLLYDGSTTRTWEAQQVSINREVVIDSLNLEQQQDEAFVATFLSDVRAKAAVDYPLIGSVFEAVRDDRLCFYAREKLHGTTLQELLDNGTILTPHHVVHILRQIAEANLYLEEHNVATLPLLPEQIYIAEHSLCRIINMAVGGERDHTVSYTDKETLGATLAPLLETDQPGSTRTRSLLDYMVDTEREDPLTWEQIRELAEGVELHLSAPTQPLLPKHATVRIQRRGNAKRLAAFAGICIILILIVAGVSTFLNQPEAPKERTLSSMVHIPAGEHSIHDNGKATLAEFWIDSHEVTIAEYAQFLEDLEALSADQIAVYQHQNQPADKTHHKPEDWDDIYAAASAGSSWKKRKIDVNHPVTGVDWWDAYTYCSLRKCQLPTADQWHAALSHSLGEKGKLTASDWGPVDQQGTDVTSNGLYGLAGNVAEWSSTLSKDPGFPTKPKMPVLLGGSFLKSHSSGSTREWLNGDSRSTRREDLGFRTISSTPPSE